MKASTTVTATDAPAGPASDTRLECVRDICAELASGLATAQHVLRNDADDGNVAHLVADALGRLGWMAERAAVLAGAGSPLTKGGADGWMLPDATASKAFLIDKAMHSAAVVQEGGAA